MRCENEQRMNTVKYVPDVIVLLSCPRTDKLFDISILIDVTPSMLGVYLLAA